MLHSGFYDVVEFTIISESVPTVRGGGLPTALTVPACGTGAHPFLGALKHKVFFFLFP